MRKALGAKRIGANIGRAISNASQMKYQYEVVVHELLFLSTPPTDSVSVLWTRGSKTAITSEHQLVAAGCSIEQQLTLICTLFREREGAGGEQSFAEKLCTFAIIEQGKRGTRTVAKCKVDISPHAEVRQLDPNISP